MRRKCIPGNGNVQKRESENGTDFERLQGDLLNSFYWDLKRALAEIGCKVELYLTNTDSVLYQVTKVTSTVPIVWRRR